MMDCNLYATRYLQFNWTCVLDVSFKSALTVDEFKRSAICSECKLNTVNEFEMFTLNMQTGLTKRKFRGI